VRECGGVIVGGHSIATPEMYYGLSVTGRVHPKKFWANYTSKVGDTLILTKPLGMGALSTAIKADMLNLEQIKEAARYMSQLNFYAVGAMEGIRVNAATDVTGFGFLGHLSEMGRDDISFEIFTRDVPILASAREVAAIGLLPEGSYKNREFCAKFLNMDANDADILLFDAQTSGGLLLAVDANDAKNALKRLKEAGYEMTSVVGTVNERKLGQNLINLKP
jgi:selenide, water dikinase